MELESGIEKVQVLKGKGKEKGRKREGKEREGQAGKRQGREISKDRTKERTNLERKNEGSRDSFTLGLSFLSFLFLLLFIFIFDSGRREWRVNI